MKYTLDSSYSWFRLFLTLLVATTGNVGMWAIIVIMPGVEADFGVNRADASLPYTLTMAGFAIGNFVVGRWVDRFGITVSLIASILTVSAGFLAAIFSPTILMFAIAHFLIGFGTSCSFGPLISDVSQWFLKRRGIAVAIAASGNYLSGAIWPLVLSGVMQTSGWRMVYYVLAAVTILVVVPLAIALRRRVPDEVTQASDAARLNAGTGLSPKTLAILLGLAGVGCCVAMSMPQVHIVSYCVDLGYGPAAGAQMLSAMLLGGVVSRLISGWLADMIGGLRTLLIGATLQCLALFLYLPWDALVPLYVISTVFGLSQGGIVPNYAVAVREYMPAKQAGTWVGLVMMATIVGMALGGWMSGWIFDLTGSYRMAFWNGIVWNLANIAILSFVLWRSIDRRRPAMA